MLHPGIVVKRSNLGGKGMFSERKLPMGTIIWTSKENPDRIYTKDQVQGFSARYRQTIWKFGNEYDGGRISYCPDKSKYWNHSCDPNTAPTTILSVNMDIAIRDIYPDEDITFDYCLVISSTWPRSFDCKCGTAKCRGVIPGVFSKVDILANLRTAAEAAEKCIHNVDQPLLEKIQRLASM
jgi:SET domain-containing protein